jgi:hypothetical protein
MTTAITATAENMVTRTATRCNTPMAIERATRPLFVDTKGSIVSRGRAFYFISTRKAK